jgi:Reverse transcriptase (RNA-dependent DNA polymerase)
MRLESFRTLLTIAGWSDLDLRQFDVSAAYLHGEIDGKVHMESPPGHGDRRTVWKLLKGLYGLKQAGRIWHERLKADMEELGFVQCTRDHAVFRFGTRENSDWAVCAFWVDDETGVGSRKQLDRVAAMFHHKYGEDRRLDLNQMRSENAIRNGHWVIPSPGGRAVMHVSACIVRSGRKSREK